MTKKNIIFTVLAVVWMIVIFVYSSRPAEESNANSDTVEKAIMQMTVTDYDEKTEKEVENFILDWRIPIRKCAHACEYALLSFLLFFAIPDKLVLWGRGLISGAGALVYGISDEIHQSFVPGRTALVSDVLIDLAGVCCGCLFSVVIVILVRRKRRKTRMQKT